VTIEKENEYDLETRKTRHKTRLNIREVEINEGSNKKRQRRENKERKMLKLEVNKEIRYERIESYIIEINVEKDK
jgi:hypothetical protein